MKTAARVACFGGVLLAVMTFPCFFNRELMRAHERAGFSAKRIAGIIRGRHLEIRIEGCADDYRSTLGDYE